MNHSVLINPYQLVDFLIGTFGGEHTIVQENSIARRDKKAFLSEQCKEIEKNNRMGMIRDLFKKLHAKMGMDF